MSDALTAAHARISEILGPAIEPLAVFERAEEHRRYWRPETARVVLLAESHVYTSRSDLQRSIRRVPELPHDVPRGFVRLVYNLGYGENGLLDAPIIAPRNSGTWQYWRIFLACLNRITKSADCTSLLKRRTPEARQRLANKVAVLRDVRKRGVWLLDASLAALYSPQRGRLPSAIRAAVSRASWDSYVGGILEVTRPEAILCIGVGVAKTLKDRLARLRIPWAAVPQPQARLTSAEHMRILKTYHDVCEDPRRIAGVPPVL